MQVGDLVTGKDRSYPRSIYRILRTNGWKAQLRFVSLAGHIQGLEKYCGDPVVDIRDIRPATQEEIADSRWGTWEGKRLKPIVPKNVVEKGGFVHMELGSAEDVVR